MHTCVCVCVCVVTRVCVCNACVIASLGVTQDPRFDGRSIFWTSDAFDSHSARRSRMSEYRSDVYIVNDIGSCKSALYFFVGRCIERGFF